MARAKSVLFVLDYTDNRIIMVLVTVHLGGRLLKGGALHPVLHVGMFGGLVKKFTRLLLPPQASGAKTEFCGGQPARIGHFTGRPFCVQWSSWHFKWYTLLW